MCSHRCGKSRKCFAAQLSRTKHRRSLFSRLYLHWSFGCLQLAGRISGQEFVNRLSFSMYAAFQQIDPTMDTGVDFAAEYKAAMEMQKA